MARAVPFFSADKRSRCPNLYAADTVGLVAMDTAVMRGKSKALLPIVRNLTFYVAQITP